MTEAEIRAEEKVKKILKDALWQAYCEGRASNRYIPEEVLPNLMKRCQLFKKPEPDPLDVAEEG